MLTKTSAALWSADPGPAPFRHQDVTAEALAATPTRPLDPDGTGPATLVGTTVIHDRRMPHRTVAVAELGDGRRTVVVDPDAAAAAERVDLDLIDDSITVPRPGFWA
jgi:acetyl-CoA C-acetyltransferase